MAVTTQQVAEIYVATFNRAPDAAGLAYWVNDSFGGNASIEQIASSFFDSAEAQAIYTSTMTTTEKVTEAYANLFNRAPDADGLAYWVGQLDAGSVSQSNMLIALVNGALGSDATIMSNKTTVGLAFADAGLDDVTQATSVMSGVTADAATVTAAQTTITGLIPGSTLELTTANTDILIGTAHADTFTGTSTTYVDADQVIDVSTTDNDTYNLSLTSSNLTGGVATPKITNVENVNVTIATTNGTNPQVDATNMAGVTNLTVTGSNVTVGGASIAGDKDVDVANVNAAQVGTVTAGAGTVDVTLTQKTTAGVTVDASAATGAITIDGAVTLSADNATGAVLINNLTVADTTEDAKDVSINAAKAASVTTDVLFTGAVAIDAAKASTVDVNNATGGATIAAGSTSTADTTISVGNIDASGATVTTGTGYDDSVTTTLKSITVQLEGTSGTTDTATVAGAGYITLKTADDGVNTDQIENISLSGVGAATTYVLTGAPSTITVTGDQSVTIKGNVSSFDGKALVDNTTAGTTTVDITTLNTADLSGIAADAIKVSSNVASKTLTLASGANLVLASDETTAFSVAGKTANATVNIATADDTAASGAPITITTGTFTASTNVKTVNLDATVGAFTATTTVLATATGSALNITGTKDVNLGTVSNGKTIAASGMTGILTVNAQGASTATSITSGSGADSITLNQAVVFTVDAGNGDNTVTITDASNASSITTGTGADTVNINSANSVVVVTGAGDDTVNIGNTFDSDAIIVMGDGSSDKIVFGGANDFSANTNFAWSGVETMDVTAANGTVKVSAAQFAGDNVFKISGNSATADIFHVVNTSTTAGATIDASGITFDSTQAAMLKLQGAGAVGGATAGLADIITGSAKNDYIVATTGADVVSGGAGTDTYDASGLKGITVEGTGTGTSTGVVINLGSTALTSTSILGATGSYTADSLTSVAAGTTAYLFGSSASTNSAVQQTISGIENVIGTAGNDYIVAGSAGGTITGGTGADYIVANNAGADVISQGASDSVAATASTFAGATIAAADTITFGSGVDVVYGFVAGTDTIDVGTSGAAITGIGVDQTALTATKTIFLSGAYNASTHVFTIAADGTGADTLIFDTTVAGADRAVSTNDNAIVLVGVDSDNLVAGTFV